MHEPFIAVDWGTTNRRAWRIADGVPGPAYRDGAGISGVPAGGYPAAVAGLRTALGNAPMLLAGMVGADRGWVDAGYVRCPATLGDLAQGLVEAAPGIRIVPGVSLVEAAPDGVMRGDVMRGEEVQLLGAVAAGLAPADARMCQPGTHCKWARLSGGAITGFTTAMTGELFGLLRDHALIGQAIAANGGGGVADGAAFREGLARAAMGDLAAALFGVRASSLLGLRPDADAASYVSGVLIGADCRAQVTPGDRLHLLADAALGPLYTAGIEAAGGTVTPVDSEAAFLAGIVRIGELA